MKSVHNVLLSLSALSLFIAVPACSDTVFLTETGDTEHCDSETGSAAITTGDEAVEPGTAMVGELGAIDRTWRNARYLSCHDSAAVICVQYAPLASIDRVIFATPPIFGYGLTGFDGATSICQALAEDAGLPGWYAPFLGTPGMVPAMWGFQLPGFKLDIRNDLPRRGYYVLPGGEKVTQNLHHGDLLHGVDQSADGSAVSGPAWIALEDDLWIDSRGVDPAEPELTDSEQDFLILGSTCLDWGSWTNG